MERGREPGLGDVLRAHRRIKPIALRTPTLAAAGLRRATGVDAWLKLESLQPTHSFKVRGVANFLLALSTEQRARGVVTASTGNHGRALAFVARELGIPAVVCLSSLVGADRQREIRRLGVEVRVAGRDQDAAIAAARELAASQSLTLVPPFDDPWIIAGQGTIALELLQCSDPRTIVVPLSGGGLAAGVALVAKSVDPGIRVVGVSMERGAAMAASLDAGHPVEVCEVPSLADSLGGGILLDNRLTFPMVRRYVDDVMLVSEAEIARAIVFLLEEERLYVEGAGAVGVAALLSGRLAPEGEVALVVSGGNLDVGRLAGLLGASTLGAGR
ncbi:MAG: threonine/serine dehydratase [Candidatus Dormibacteraceae bacterium]